MSEKGAKAAAKNLTTRQGHPVYDNQHQRTVGSRGPSPARQSSTASISMLAVAGRLSLGLPTASA